MRDAPDAARRRFWRHGQQAQGATCACIPVHALLLLTKYWAKTTSLGTVDIAVALL